MVWNMMVLKDMLRAGTGILKQGASEVVKADQGNWK